MQDIYIYISCMFSNFYCHFHLTLISPECSNDRSASSFIALYLTSVGTKSTSSRSSACHSVTKFLQQTNKFSNGFQFLWFDDLIQDILLTFSFGNLKTRHASIFRCTVIMVSTSEYATPFHHLCCIC